MWIITYLFQNYTSVFNKIPDNFGVRKVIDVKFSKSDLEGGTLLLVACTCAIICVSPISNCCKHTHQINSREAFLRKSEQSRFPNIFLEEEVKVCFELLPPILSTSTRKCPNLIDVWSSLSGSSGDYIHVSNLDFFLRKSHFWAICNNCWPVICWCIDLDWSKFWEVYAE